VSGAHLSAVLTGGREWCTPVCCTWCDYRWTWVVHTCLLYLQVDVSGAHLSAVLTGGHEWCTPVWCTAHLSVVLDVITGGCEWCTPVCCTYRWTWVVHTCLLYLMWLQVDVSGAHLSAILEACLPYLSARQPACLQLVSNLQPINV